MGEICRGADTKFYQGGGKNTRHRSNAENSVLLRGAKALHDFNPMEFLELVVYRAEDSFFRKPSGTMNILTDENAERALQNDESHRLDISKSMQEPAVYLSFYRGTANG
ncbi:hypothetical protein N7528_005477 [Penicillium herquei]|nr:hypothetical protein N7528_005477 [Penicillium herquei]